MRVSPSGSHGRSALAYAVDVARYAGDHAHQLACRDERGRRGRLPPVAFYFARADHSPRFMALIAVMVIVPPPRKHQAPDRREPSRRWSAAEGVNDRVHPRICAAERRTRPLPASAFCARPISGRSATPCCWRASALRRRRWRHCPISASGAGGSIAQRRGPDRARSRCRPRKAGAKYLFHDQPDYPRLLGEIDGAPPIVTYRGDAFPCGEALRGDGRRAQRQRGGGQAGTRLRQGRLWRRRASRSYRVLRAGSTARRMKGAMPQTIGVIASGIDIAYPPQHAEPCRSGSRARAC